MAEITAAMVKELREKTDAPMMECKKALTEADGDMAKAEEILRVKLGNRAHKAASRVAAEGVVAIDVDAAGKVGAIVEVNSETDFVAKNADFVQFAKDLAKLVATNKPSDVQALSSLPLSSSTVEAARAALIGKINENISIRRFARVEAKGQLASYIHGSKIGVLVDVTGGDATLAKDIAMQVAARKPVAVDASSVSADLVETERRIAVETAREEGKPESMFDKISQGRVQKYLREVTLLGQVFVKDESGKQTIEQLLKTKSASVNSFVLYVVGEGIEKKQADFAAEVAAMATARG